MTFLYPLVLTALLVLPALWYILRVTPPAPKHITLPTTRFLQGLIPDEQEPNKTPWWILLMRLLALACIIIAFAKPVSIPSEQIVSNKNIPIRIAIDNGWASAPHWNTIQRQADDIISEAIRQNRTVYLWALASEETSIGPITAENAKSSLNKLTPKPWETNYKTLSQKHKPHNDNLETIWLGHGIKSSYLERFAELMNNDGSLTYLQPEDIKISFLLRNDPESSPKNPSIIIESPVPDTHKSMPLRLGVYGDNNKLLDQKEITFTPDKFNQMRVFLELPNILSTQISSIRLSNFPSAGTVLLKNTNESLKTIGIVGSKGNEEDSPLINAEFYLHRALETSGTIHIDILENLLDIQELSVLILPDITGIGTNTLDKLDNWVKNGGTLIRFAGPNMTQANIQEFPLTPVPLRKGGRMLDGSMTWDQTSTLESFPENSPFYGLQITEELPIKRQLLAEPTADLDSKIWALLSDGSPLVTGSKHGQGVLSFFHVTATPQWSDLPLTGMYIQMLKKLAQLSSSQLNQTVKKGRYDAVSILNGLGQVTKPSSNLKPIEGKVLITDKPSKDHPPGIYHMNGNYFSYNLGDHTTKLIKIKDNFFPSDAKFRTYGNSFEKDYTAYFLIIATLLFIADWVVMYIMIMNTSFFRITSKLIPILLLTLLATPINPSEANDKEYARNTYLAYIVTGDRQTDQVSKAGLETLANMLTRRTSVEPEGVVAINLETDNIGFYPFLYWPITTQQPPLSSIASQKLQAYMDHGGTIFIDTRDQHYAPNDADSLLFTPSQHIKKMRSLTASLTLPALTPIDKDHVLSRSFYLLKSYPGRHTGGTLWVEKEKNNGHDGVSRVIVGSHDWASAWAYNQGNISVQLKGGHKQYDMATRVGVNIALYCLTGNYKADQIHLPHILERLGR